MAGQPLDIRVDCPPWVVETVDWGRAYLTDEDRMRLAVDLSRQNVERRTGGPFGAAIFEAESGRLVSVGVNSVLRLNNCTLHGEMVAFMLAQHRVGSFTLRAPNLPAHEMFTSCEPCAMCLGATLWSGVTRLVYAATGTDARELGFEEGPVFPESHRYLGERGVELAAGPLRPDARRVLQRYAELEGVLYNG